MKRYFKTIFLVTFIGIFLFLGFRIISQIIHKNEVAQNIKSIPVFSYQNINGENFTNQSLKKETAVIFIYFNTECDYCINEAQMIKENITQFKDVQLVFVSFENPELIKKFAQKHQLITYDTIYFLSDNKVSFSTTFDSPSMPSMILYNKKHQLIAKIKGQTKVSTLLKKINAE